MPWFPSTFFASRRTRMTTGSSNRGARPKCSFFRPRGARVERRVAYGRRPGDVKRLADREVALVKASDQFDAEWRKAVTSFQAAFQVAYESKDTGSQALQDRVVEEWTAHALKLTA